MVNRKMLTVLIPVVALLVAGIVLVPRQGNATPALTGTLLPGDPAPDFHLRDQFGRAVTLSRLRGRAVLVTFLRAHCRETCPVVAEDIRHSLSALGAQSKSAVVLVISTDPEGDTPRAIRWFSRKHAMLYRWRYLVGTRSQLTPIWHDFHVYAPPRNAPAVLRDSHTTATFLIDPQGRERVLLTGALNSATLARDLQMLAGLPVISHVKQDAPAPEVGHLAPNVSLPSVAGTTISLRSFRGKVVLLNFWATWCTPCRTEMPLLQAQYEKLRRKGFLVLGVDKQEPRGDVTSFLHQLSISYPVVLDGSGSAGADYNVIAIPASFLIDRHGIVRSVHLGVLDQQYFVTQVDPLLRAGI